MRLIDADELKTAFPCGESVRTECVRATIDHMQTIEPERKKGGWIDDATELGCCCSKCGVTLDDYFYGSLHEICLSKMPNYCPNCGSYNGGE